STARKVSPVMIARKMAAAPSTIAATRPMIRSNAFMSPPCNVPVHAAVAAAACVRRDGTPALSGAPLASVRGVSRLEFLHQRAHDLFRVLAGRRDAFGPLLLERSGGGAPGLDLLVGRYDELVAFHLLQLQPSRILVVGPAGSDLLRPLA